MYRSRPSDDRVRSWHRFCRGGWRLAWACVILWFSALTLLFRVVPMPVPLPHETPAHLSWWPPLAGEAAAGTVRMDVRALWTPSAFALSSPAGFSHSLRHERARLTPPVQIARPDAVLMENPGPAGDFDLLKPGRIPLTVSETSSGRRPSGRVFPPREPVVEAPHLSFPDGWESRLFSGIDLNFGSWSEAAWSAQAEIRFNEKGVPVSVLLARPSGLADVDRRLARSLSGWRLLESAAPRTGLVAWTCPQRSPVTAADGPGTVSGEGEVP